MQALADSIAAHAWSLLAALLVTVTVLASLLWHLFERIDDKLWQRAVAAWSRASQRAPLKQLQQRHPQLLLFFGRRLKPGGYLGLHLSLGFLIVLAALALFAMLAEAVHADQTIVPFDNALAAAMRHSLAPSLLQASYMITQLGNFRTLLWISIAVALILLVRRQWLLLTAWLVATAGNGLLNRALKELFQRMRPLHDHGLLTAHGWSFPSGHASGSLVVYGMLAYLLIRPLPPRARLPLVVLTLALILMIGFSRVFLQVHYFSDVVAGFASATVWLAICVTGVEIARHHPRRTFGSELRRT